jgi:hypothetical protein
MGPERTRIVSSESTDRPGPALAASPVLAPEPHGGLALTREQFDSQLPLIAERLSPAHLEQTATVYLEAFRYKVSVDEMVAKPVHLSQQQIKDASNLSIAFSVVFSDPCAFRVRPGASRCIRDHPSDSGISASERAAPPPSGLFLFRGLEVSVSRWDQSTAPHAGTGHTGSTVLDLCYVEVARWLS